MAQSWSLIFRLSLAGLNLNITTVTTLLTPTEDLAAFHCSFPKYKMKSWVLDVFIFLELIDSRALLLSDAAPVCCRGRCPQTRVTSRPITALSLGGAPLFVLHTAGNC